MKNTKRKENKPRVSVVASVYNIEEYLDEMITSVLGQTFQDFELIIYDDGSTDSTPEIVNKYIADPRVRYFWEENAGQSDGFAVVLERLLAPVRGEFIAFIGGDDVCMPQRLQRQVGAFDADPDLDILHTDGSFINAYGAALPQDFQMRHAYNSCSFRRRFFRQNCVAHPTVMMRTRCLEKMGAFESAFAPDHQFWLKSSPHLKYAYLDEKLIKYRVHPKGGSTTREGVQRAIEASTGLIKDVRKRHSIEDLYPELGLLKGVDTALAAAYMDMGNTILSSIYPCKELAIVEYEQALANLPVPHPAILHNIAIAHAASGEGNKAVAILKDLASSGYAMSAEALRVLNGTQNVTVPFAFANEVCPEMGRVFTEWDDLAQLTASALDLARLGNWDEARRRALRMKDSEDPHARSVAKKVLQACKKKNADDLVCVPSCVSDPAAIKAIAAARTAAVGEISGASAIISQAIAAAGKGDHKTARSLLWNAIQADPNNASAYYNLATIQLSDGNLLDAADSACKALEIDPRSKAVVEILSRIETMLKGAKPTPQAKGKKHASKNGMSRADIDSRLKRVRAALSKSASIANEKPSLSLCMIVRDEEAFLDDCLKSVKGFVDEIVVVDTGSKDKTVDIAKRYGAKVHSFKWNGSFSAARNHALKHVIGEWVLCLDADERLDENSKPFIAQAIASNAADALDLNICSYLSDGPRPEVEISTCCRLFRNNPEYRFKGRIHEQVGESVVNAGGRTAKCQGVIYHYGYRPEVMDSRKKYEKYIGQLRKEVEANPNDLYYLFHLGGALAGHGEYKEAIPVLERAEKALTKGHDFAPLLFARLAESLMVVGKYKEALHAVERAERVGVKHPQLSYNKGNILRCLSRYNEAADAFEAALQLGGVGLWEGDPSTYGYKAEYGLAASCFALDDYQSAVEYAQKALESKPGDKNISDFLAKAMELAKKPGKKTSKRVRNSAEKPKLSLCMIAKNEEQFIKGCLDSAKDIVDEIIIVDTGSTDKTQEIVESYGASVYSFPWNESYADARNEALKHATGDWVLVLDADEKLDADTSGLILREIMKPSSDGYTLLFRNVMGDGDNPDLTIHRVCRLFRNNPDYRYEGRIHEHIESNIQRSGGKVSTLDAVVYHYGYKPTVVAERGKHERYVRMLQLEVDERPDDVFYLHHFASALSAGREFDRAIPYLRHGCELVDKTNAFATLLYAHLANALREVGKSDEAVQVAEEAERKGIRYPQISFCKGQALLLLNRPQEAIAALNDAIMTGRGKTWTGDATTVSYKADFGLAKAYFQLEDYDTAIKYAELTLSQKPRDVSALDLLARIYRTNGNHIKFEEYLLKLHEVIPGDSQIIITIAELCEKQGRLVESASWYEKLLNVGEETATLRVKLGNLAEATQQIAKAEQHYIRAIQISKQSPETYNALGPLYSAQGRFQEALDCYSKAIEVDPAFANSYFNAGDVLYTVGNYTQAADLYQTGLTHNSSHAAAYLRLGNCYCQMGVFDAAAIAFRQALVAQPNYPEATANLALAEEMMVSRNAA